MASKHCGYARVVVPFDFHRARNGIEPVKDSGYGNPDPCRIRGGHNERLRLEVLGV